MTTKKFPDIIIATKVAGFDRYVSRAVMQPNKTRTAHLTNDPEKAERFFTNDEANQMIENFPKDGNKYIPEPFAPAAKKNNAYATASH